MHICHYGFLLLPELGSFLSDEVPKETHFFFWFFSMLLERIIKSRCSFCRMRKRFFFTVVPQAYLLFNPMTTSISPLARRYEH